MPSSRLKSATTFTFTSVGILVQKAFPPSSIRPTDLYMVSLKVLPARSAQGAAVLVWPSSSPTPPLPLKDVNPYSSPLRLMVKEAFAGRLTSPSNMATSLSLWLSSVRLPLQLTATTSRVYILAIEPFPALPSASKGTAATIKGLFLSIFLLSYTASSALVTPLPPAATISSMAASSASTRAASQDTIYL